MQVDTKEKKVRQCPLVWSIKEDAQVLLPLAVEESVSFQTSTLRSASAKAGSANAATVHMPSASKSTHMDDTSKTHIKATTMRSGGAQQTCSLNSCSRAMLKSQLISRPPVFARLHPEPSSDSAGVCPTVPAVPLWLVMCCSLKCPYLCVSILLSLS